MYCTMQLMAGYPLFSCFHTYVCVAVIMHDHGLFVLPQRILNIFGISNESVVLNRRIQAHMYSSGCILHCEE